MCGFRGFLGNFSEFLGSFVGPNVRILARLCGFSPVLCGFAPETTNRTGQGPIEENAPAAKDRRAKTSGLLEVQFTLKPTVTVFVRPVKTGPGRPVVDAGN